MAQGKLASAGCVTTTRSCEASFNRSHPQSDQIFHRGVTPSGLIHVKSARQAPEELLVPLNEAEKNWAAAVVWFPESLSHLAFH